MRVAFLPDSFHEVNGVAHTSRNFVRYAERHGLPMLCIHAGRGALGGSVRREQRGSVQMVELPRSRASVGIEKDLSFDPLFARHRGQIARALREFKPDVLHITGPSELGIAGAYYAWRQRVPLAASWHTNLHEYAARRTAGLARIIPGAGPAVERTTLWATLRFYRLAQLLFAPNRELCAMLESRTGKPCLLMQRGVDTELFTPARRQRKPGDQAALLGYVGRLSVEKNIALLPEIQRELRHAGVIETRFLIAGHGGDEGLLRSLLPDAEFLGVQRGEALAASYAAMDLFVFPSETDTFGNVVLEALSSGVPAVVTRGGGPKFIVEDGVTGRITDPAGFATVIAGLLKAPEELQAMRLAARAHALTCSWDAVFDRVLAAYAGMLSAGVQAAPAKQAA